jgi:hypothetical protein
LPKPVSIASDIAVANVPSEDSIDIVRVPAGGDVETRIGSGDTAGPIKRLAIGIVWSTLRRH